MTGQGGYSVTRRGPTLTTSGADRDISCRHFVSESSNHRSCLQVATSIVNTLNGGSESCWTLKRSLGSQALAKYAFGLGLLQMLFTTAAFTVFSLPVGHGIGTVILEQVCTLDQTALRPPWPRDIRANICITYSISVIGKRLTFPFPHKVMLL